MKVLAVIPARYASTRFPGKPLALLGGKPVLQWVWEGVRKVGREMDVVVATDDDRIADAARAFGAEVMLTSPSCKNGTARCKEVVREWSYRQYDVVVNVQGDEPFVEPRQIEDLLDRFASEEVGIATLATPIRSVGELCSPNCVKVVVNGMWKALYFSRQPIPYQRGVEVERWLNNYTYWKHVGIYAYRTEVLRRLGGSMRCSLEECESLEQLNWLDAGYSIDIVRTEHANIGIDTPEDLAEAEKILNRTK